MFQARYCFWVRSDRRTSLTSQFGGIHDVIPVRVRNDDPLQPGVSSLEFVKYGQERLGRCVDEERAVPIHNEVGIRL